MIKCVASVCAIHVVRCWMPIVQSKTIIIAERKRESGKRITQSSGRATKSCNRTVFQNILNIVDCGLRLAARTSFSHINGVSVHSYFQCNVIDIEQLNRFSYCTTPYIVQRNSDKFMKRARTSVQYTHTVLL